MKIALWFLLLFSVNCLAFDVDSKLGKITDQCGVKDSKNHVWIFKQWHLSPNVDSTKSAVLPQEVNQTAIYEQLDLWVRSGLHTIISEGCSGVIDDKFSQKFNEWNLQELKKKVSSSEFKKIITLVPLKLEAKYGDKIKVPCGDDEALVNEQSFALSDARGTLGFLSRLTQYKDDPERVKSYLGMVVKLDHLSDKTSASEAIEHLKSELKKNIEKINLDFTKRNEKFVATIKAQDDKDMALVIGGIHASQLALLLKKAKIDCTVIEPVGYHSDDEKSLSDLNKIVGN